MNDCRLVGDDEAVVRGTLYVGLHEFEEMAFLLHLLRPGDTFADIGAGVGAYTVLASQAVGAITHAVEPNPQRCARLHDNIALNRMERRIHVHPAESGGARLEIDEILGENVPVALRLDLPQELESTLEGAACSLASEWMQAMLVRLPVRSAARLHVYITTFGFTRTVYDPLTRTLREAGPPVAPFRRRRGGESAPALYVRDRTWALRRLKSAPPFHTLGQSI